MQRCAFVVNPNAGKGRCGREWRSLQGIITSKFKETTTRFSQYPSEIAEGIDVPHVLVLIQTHPIALVRELIAAGWDLIAAVGGDGTINECVNGYVQSGGREKGVSLGVISMGTGGDFVRTVGIPSDAEMALEVISQGYQMDIDLGYCRFGSSSEEKDELRDGSRKGPMKERYFINMLGAGVGGEVCENVKKAHNRLGGKLTYMCVSVTSTLRFVNRPLKFRLDGGEWHYQKCFNFVVANGRYQGGGMMIAPTAELCDGSFDVVVLGDMRVWGSLVPFISRVYSGSHLDISQIALHKGIKTVEVCVDDRPGHEVSTAKPVLVEVDGEALNSLPLVASVVPRALSIIVPASTVRRNCAVEGQPDPLDMPVHQHEQRLPLVPAAPPVPLVPQSPTCSTAAV